MRKIFKHGTEPGSWWVFRTVLAANSPFADVAVLGYLSLLGVRDVPPPFPV